MTTGILLLTYGSPANLDDVAAYLTRVRGGRAPTPEILTEFRRRYEVIGLSPLVALTRRQAAALEAALGAEFGVAAGMRFSEPSLAAAVADLRARGATRLLGVVLSPQFSPLLMGGYSTALAAAANELPWRLAGAWHLNPTFVDVMASRIRQTLLDAPREERAQVPVLLTAHSLPRRVVDREPDYVAQLRDTADAIAAAAALDPRQWQFVYQSAGHTPEEWLRPDLLDVLPELAAAGHRTVMVAPVQFLADHLETLYDVDVAAREQARAAGIEALVRTPAPNDAPDFALALRSVVLGELAAWPADDSARAPAGAPA